jgi:hypothetical protein
MYFFVIILVTQIILKANFKCFFQALTIFVIFLAKSFSVYLQSFVNIYKISFKLSIYIWVIRVWKSNYKISYIICVFLRIASNHKFFRNYLSSKIYLIIFHFYNYLFIQSKFRLLTLFYRFALYFINHEF